MRPERVPSFSRLPLIQSCPRSPTKAHQVRCQMARATPRAGRAAVAPSRDSESAEPPGVPVTVRARQPCQTTSARRSGRVARPLEPVQNQVEPELEAALFGVVGLEVLPDMLGEVGVLVQWKPSEKALGDG